MKGEIQRIARDVNFVVLRNEHDDYLRERRGVCPETIKEMHTYLERFFQWFRRNYVENTFWEFDFKKLREFVDSYHRSHSPGSYRWMSLSLRSFLRYCHLEGYLRCDLTPLLSMRRRWHAGHVPNILNDSELLKLVNGLRRESTAEKRDYAIILLLACYGVRGSQVRRLLLADVDWEAGRINFPAVKNGNGTSHPLLPEVGNALADYLIQGRPSCDIDHLFLSLKAPPAPLGSSGSLSTIVARRFKDAGVIVPQGVRVGSHIFRHTFASRLLRAEEPLKNISDMLGHRYHDSTMVYAKIDMTGLRNATLNWEDSYYENF